MRIITHVVVIGHPQGNARKMSSGCQSTAGLAVVCVLKVQCQSKQVTLTHSCKASALTPLHHPYSSVFCIVGCVSLRISKIGLLNPKESKSRFCISLLNRSI